MLDAEHLNTKSVLAEAYQCLQGYDAAALALAPVQPMLSAELRSPSAQSGLRSKTTHTERTTGTRWDSKRTLRICRGQR